jgi:hypothetical protein
MGLQETIGVLVATPANPLTRTILPNASHAPTGGLPRYPTYKLVLFVLLAGMVVKQKPIAWRALVESLATKREN